MRKLVFLFMIWIIFPSMAQASEQEEWIVRLRNESEIEMLTNAYKTKVLDVDGAFAKMSLTEEEVSEIKQLPYVLQVEPNYVKRAASVPNDPFFYEQWALQKIDWVFPNFASRNLLIGQTVAVDGKMETYTGQTLKGKDFVFTVGDQSVSRLSVQLDHVEGTWRLEVLDDAGNLLGWNEGTLAKLDVRLNRSAPTIHVRVQPMDWTVEPTVVEIKAVDHLLVAVIDSGVRMHEDFGDNILYSLSVDYAEKKRYAEDTFGHGTHVTGIVAAVANNAKGISGVIGNAPVDILPIKVLDHYGSGGDFEIAKGVRYALEKGADMINLSLAGKGETTVLRSAIDDAIHQGVLVVAAAGNSHMSTATVYPASYPGVITVSATNERDEPISIANYGWEVDLSAPGDNILSTYLNGYRTLRGTSMAAPYVTGALAVLKTLHPHEDAIQLRTRLLETAKDVHERGYDIYSGYGLLQMQKAIQSPVPSQAVDWLDFQHGQPIEKGRLYWIGFSPSLQGKTAHLFFGGRLVHSFTITNWLMTVRLSDFISEKEGDISVLVTDGNKKVIAFENRTSPIRPTTFRDVPPKHWAYKVVQQAQSLSFVRGYGDGTFRPNDRLSRRHGIMMMNRAFGWEAPSVLSSPFRDVSLSSSGALAVLNASERHILKGADGKAQLDQPLTRGQMALMLVRALQIENETIHTSHLFQDVTTGEVRKAVQLLAERGIVAKQSAFRPNDPITRAEFAAMLVRVHERKK
ncbi:S-layer family protein [Thermolongibacillus altinsuensis]|uniref:S-layer family protein n=1 Tax=Thermolongibacillus altinsuensis TaxID=575256 RepID=A0A4R1QBU3_9BACL|nr:S8 family serine peptidase [Thermolongibacillus altinsuensis]TCL47644.1 S-layer family protein [Thermolongibacillus altinsuensis]